MKKKGTAIVVLTLMSIVSVWAIAAPPKNVIGYNRIEAPADSDILVSVPLNLNPVGTYTVVTKTGTGVTVAPGSFTDDAFNNDDHYARFAGGHWSTITANDPAELVLADLDILSSVNVGDTFTVYPHQTLAAVFPKKLEQFAFIPSKDSSLGNRETEILMPSDADNTNKSPSATYYYIKWSHPTLGLIEGWRQSGASPLLDKGGVVIRPDSYIILRNSHASRKLVFIVKGLVPMGKVATKVSTKAVQYDLNFGTNRPVGVKIGQLGLEPVFAASATASLGDRKDELLVYNNADGKKNKAPVATYYYINWNHPTLGLIKGWRLSGVSPLIDQGDVKLSPSQGLIIRKAAGTPAPGYAVQNPLY